VKRPNRSPVLVASITGLVLVAIGLAALIATRPSSTEPSGSAAPAAQGSAPPSAVVVGAIDASSCAIQQGPGPADAPPKPGGEGIDVADLGPGRFRLCLTDPTTVTVEGTAWCVWSDDRTSVTEIDGLPTAAGGGPRIAGTVGLRPPHLQIEATSASGEISTFGNDGDQRLVEPGPGAHDGAATFSVTEVVDPDHPAQAPILARTGTLRWTCGEPPAPRPGRSAGTVALHLDSPINADWAVAATCTWVTTPAGAVVSGVDVVGLPLGDRTLALGLSPRIAEPKLIAVNLSMTRLDQSASWGAGDSSIVYRQAPDASSGLVRLPRLNPDDPAAPQLVAGVDAPAGHVSWTCGPPFAPGRAEPADVGPNDGIAGTALVTFEPEIAAPIRTAVTCHVEVGGPTVRLAGIDGKVPFGEGGLLLFADDGVVRVAIVAPDGSPGGEYEGAVSVVADDLSLGGLRLRSDSLTFGPTDPRYVPIGGPAAPRTVAVGIEIDCDPAGGGLPGLTTGHMELGVRSGIDRSWTVAATCTWRLVGGKPTVTQVVNAGALTIDDREFRAFARPDLMLVVERFGTTYQALSRSVVEGPAAADGSSGQLTFRGLAPRGRIPNVNGRLGGRDGPLSVDGTITWSCGAPPAVVPEAAPA